MKPDYKLVAKAKYIQLAAALADELWRECYKRYYTPKQLTAVLDALQSPEAIEEDIDSGANYFIVVLGDKPIGYFAWRMENTAMHLMHLYLKPEYRGKALGRDILNSCERLARSDGKGRVRCAVHTRALPVMQFFKARGYRAAGPAETLAGGVPMELTELEHILR